MEHRLLSPLTEVILMDRLSDPGDLSAANIVAYRLLRGAYLGETYASYQLAEIAPDEWRLFQDWRGDAQPRDPMRPFYESPYMDVDEDRKDQFIVQPRPMQVRDCDLTFIQGEEGISSEIRARADALMDRVLQHAPGKVQRLLDPALEHVQARKDLRIDVFTDTGELADMLRDKLGDGMDWSLRSYGIDYHSFGHFSHKSVFLVATNADEVAGMLKLGANEPGSYVLSYVSVAPGFREQGLSKALYARAIDLCQRDERVLIRSQPGEFTRQHPIITLSYDKMVKESHVLHADSESPFRFLFKTSLERGMTYAQMLARYKPDCDAAVPSPEDRNTGLPMTWQQREVERESVARLLKETEQDTKPRRRMAP